MVRLPQSVGFHCRVAGSPNLLDGTRMVTLAYHRPDTACTRGVLNRFGESWPEMRRKPGTDTKFPAQFAGNWLSAPGFAPRDMLPVRRAPKTAKHPCIK